MQSMKPISLARSRLDPVPHLCALFRHDNQEYRVLRPSIKDRFECVNKAIHVVNPEQQDDRIQRLSPACIDTAGARNVRQFELRLNTGTYLWNGQVDQDGLLEVFEQLATGNARCGFALSRIVCRMDRTADGRRYVEHLIELESGVNDGWRLHDDSVICTYHLGHFIGETVIDIRRTHPLVIIGGSVQKSPFSVPTEQFPPECRERTPRQTLQRARV